MVIPTFKRAHLIGYVFEALTKQTYKDFEVLVILKPSGDKTENIVKNYEKLLKMKLIFQNRGYFVDALNLGLKHAKGDIIAFLDDDVIPFPDWVQRHIETYEKSDIGGVAGNVIPATLKEAKSLSIKDEASEIIPNLRPFLDSIGRNVWDSPLEGLENYLVYVSKAGVVEYNYKISHLAWRQITKSLLGMGANMSVLAEAVKGFGFPSSWIRGLTNEQFLGWHIWKRGYDLVFNPNARVYHLVGHQTLSRKIKDTRNETLRWIEYELLFYRLYGIEPGLSTMHRITWLIFSTLVDFKKICKDKDLHRIIRLKGRFLGNLIGVKWLLCRKLGLSYDPLRDLQHVI